MSSLLTISFEFFPPKTPEGVANVKEAAVQLAKCNPDFFSVTFGAGGSTRSGTIETLDIVRQETGGVVAPHISCVGTTQQDIISLLKEYQDKNVQRLVVLRGDEPPGLKSVNEFHYASELVRFIKDKTGDCFRIEVAAYPEFHPEAKSAHEDILNLKRKYEAGASSALTQYFYNPDAYFYYLDDCMREGINIPIVPGIMPITQFHSLARFSDRCGAEIPMWIRKRLESYGDDLKSIKEFGTEVVYKLCERLIHGGAPGLHFYTLNKHHATMDIIKQLNLSDLENIEVAGSTLVT